MSRHKQTASTIAFGDFQTPSWLAEQVCQLLASLGCSPDVIIEPTCGVGSFLLAALKQFPAVPHVFGMDINKQYVAASRAMLIAEQLDGRATVENIDFFKAVWSNYISSRQRILFVGNPPWVTNTQLAKLESDNLPDKKNRKGISGIEAVTGSSNFDVSEWMLLKLLQLNEANNITLAMLCKTTVARKVLKRLWSDSSHRIQAKIFRIDASQAFNVSVDACLLYVAPTEQMASRRLACDVYASLSLDAYETTFGYREGTVVANAVQYDRWQHLRGGQVDAAYRWRSGIKHDCAAVMELRRVGDIFINHSGQTVEIEDDYLYPMLKSSDVAKWPDGSQNDRWMVVPQRRVGQDTRSIKVMAPKTWHYLLAHASRLDKRKSSIYRGKPRFSIFGVGDYSFSPWKIAISGLYKELTFALVGPHEAKPVVLDDTCYLLPCWSEEEAVLLHQLVSSEPAQAFYEAHIFWDAKRPITTKLLNRLDLFQLARAAGMLDELQMVRSQVAGQTALQPTQLTLFR